MNWRAFSDRTKRLFLQTIPSVFAFDFLIDFKLLLEGIGSEVGNPNYFENV